jgi:parallel beta-helix repeat protein/predicted outer membrane repeat protein
MKTTKNLLYAIILTVFSFVSANATVLTVTNNQDNLVPGSFPFLLATAVTGDTIVFNLNPVGDTIFLITSPITITSDVTVIGPGSGLLAIDGVGVNRGLDVNSPNVSISGMTIMNCDQSANDGGGLLNFGGLTLRDVVFHDNHSGGLGGAIANYGQMMIDECQFLHNASASGGGGFFCSTNGSAMIDSCFFADNSCLTYGGAIRSITNINTIVTNSFFDNNGAGNSGGGAYIDATAVSVVDFNDCEFTRNHTNGVGYGGAVFVGGGAVTFNRTKMFNNQSADGAGIAMRMITSTPNVNINQCTIENNTASGYGGGLHDDSDGSIIMDNTTISHNEALFGGGIYILNGTSTTINGTTINDNHAVINGGGIHSDNSLIDLTNCTISGNSCESNGGGISATSSSAAITLINVTVTQNEAGGSGNGGGFFAVGSSSFTLLNTIIAENTAAIGPDTYNSTAIVTSNGYNVIGDATNIGTTANTGDNWGNAATPIDPLLGELDYYNGITKSHHPSCNSPAVDNGATAGAPAQDQRGLPRVGIYDIGAVEHQNPAASPPTATLTGNTEICQDGLAGDSLTLTLTGTPPFNILVTDGAGFEYFENIFVTTYKWRPTSPGTYSVVTITDNGCGLGSGSGSVNVPNTSLDISFTGLTQATCAVDNGAVTAVVTGETGPSNYQWSNGDQTLAADSLGAGLYLFIVMDNGTGCWTEKYALVNDNGGPTVSVNNVTPVTCHDSLTGAIDIDIVGGLPPYSVRWSTGETTEDISNLAVGPYEVKVTDANGCESFFGAIVPQPNELEVNINTTPATCSVSDGSGLAVVTGGTPGYNFSWSSGGTSALESGLPGGFYDVTVTDANGCTAQAYTGIPEAGAPIVARDSTISSDCGIDNGGLFITPAGGSGNYSIDWNSGLSTMEDLNGVPNGNYFCLTTDNVSGCRVAKHWEINSIRPDVTPICLATVDSASQNNLIAWEKLPNLGIKNYLVYRGTSDPSTFALVANIPYDSLSEFIDTVANTNQQWWRYKLRTVDSCGVGSFLSEAVMHKTIQLTLHRGSSPTVFNLIWSHYSGYDYTQYNIYRYDNTNGWVNRGSVPPNQNTFQDITTDTLGLYYVVIAPHPAGCVVTRAAGNNNTSRSNEAELVAGPGANTIPENESIIGLEVYPNPNNGKFDLLLNMRSSEEILLNIYDVQGRLIESESWNTAEGTQMRSFDLSSQHTGVYTIQLIAPDRSIHKRIIVR